LLVEVAAMSRTCWFWAAVGILALAAQTRGDQLPGSASVSAERIATLVEQLDEPDFVSRQAASQRLEEVGAAALPQLEATAAAGSREASSRALDILKRHFQGGGDEVRPAAREALERLAASQNPSTAQKARDVLNPPKPSSIIPVGFQAPPPPRVNGFGGGFGAAPPNAGVFRRISVSTINGRKSVEIDERERNVKMAATPTGGIQVEITDKINPRNPVRRIDAKDENDLRKKDGELARLYDQIRPLIQQQQLGGMPPGLMPVVPMPMAPMPGQIELIDGLIARYKLRLATDPNTQRMIDSLEQAKQRFQALAPAGEAARLVR